MQAESDVMDLLRHTVATVSYRAAKVLRDAPPGFETIKAGPTTRSALQIVSHMADLYAWAILLADGIHQWTEPAPRDWHGQIDRFFENLKTFDNRLASAQPLNCAPGQLFQGPIADSLTHIGQLATLRRLAGAPIRGENYFKASIRCGQVSLDQPASNVEFD